MDETTMESVLRSLIQNTIHLTIGGKIVEELGATRFGGRPDVPADFAWPYFETSTYDDDTVKPRPLSFLAQFRCRDLVSMDTEHRLPADGLLSFFYELGSMSGGYDPETRESFQVYWFPEGTALSTAEFPADLENDYRLPALGIGFEASLSLPEWEDFAERYPDLVTPANWKETGDRFDSVVGRLAQELGIAEFRADEEEDGDYSRLLGWPRLIQGSVALECEMTAARGIYMGGDKPIPEDVFEQAKKTASDWQLLFQLDSIYGDEDNGGFELMFGDCGCIYFCIRTADLAARRFDRCWLIMQCC